MSVELDGLSRATLGLAVSSRVKLPTFHFYCRRIFSRVGHSDVYSKNLVVKSLVVVIMAIGK